MMRKTTIIFLAVCFAAFFSASMAFAADSNGWVAGDNTWDQWQDTNFSEHTGGTDGGLHGNSHEGMDMWGGAGASVWDPSSYVSEVILGQTTDVTHPVSGGTISYKLDEIQDGFMDLTAHPGQTKDVSVGGENDTHADLHTSLDRWQNDATCDRPADSGAVMASEGTANVDMSGWVTGVAKGDEASYKAQVFQQIGHERTNEIPGGTMSSFSQSTQLGTIDIGVKP